MGIPSFYKWLVRKYPKIATNAVGEKGESVDGSSLPNPNGFEFDNLYLDMNEIIWDIFCPSDEEESSEPTTIEDGLNAIFQYIDSLFSIVRPRKLLYLAIDGVPPRAKWGQCCAGRFCTAKLREIEEEVEGRLRQQLEREGKQVLPELESELSVSVVITPGTEFMQKLSKALKSYVSSRLRSDLGWRNIKVILSDANVPEEGEQKIVAFIRRQRALQSYDPNTSHCIFGRDADFIILALAMHEVHVSILRKNHWNFKPDIDKRLSTAESTSIVTKPYQFVHLWILREYLELDFQIPDPPEDFQFDIERIIDDFVFMSFFVGNDFLPRTPSLKVDENAIDLLMFVYKKELKNIGGYLVDTSKIEDSEGGYIELSRVERFVSLVGSYENKIFRKRSHLEDRKPKRLLLTSNALEEDDTDDSMTNATNKLSTYSNLLKNTNELKEKVKENLRNSGLYGDGVDRVRLGATGYKERYYKERFSEKYRGDIETIRKDIVVKYTEGLLWTLLYYFQGPPSWTWYYPYRAGPFVSDLKGLSQIKIRFEKGSPLKPIENLMAIIPLSGVFALPKAYQALMKEDSPIIDPESCYEIERVIEGKRCVCQVPVIDEGRLLSEARKLENDLQDEEKERNTQRLDQLLVRCTHKLGSLILSFSEEQNEVKRAISLSDEIGGFIWLPLENTVTGNHVCNNNEDDSVLCVFYELPNDDPHIPCLVSRVKCPNKIVSESDIQERKLWHEYPLWNPNFSHKSTRRGAGWGKPNGGNNESSIEETSSSHADSASSSSHEPSHYFGPEWLAGRGKPINRDDARALANCTTERTNDQQVTNIAYVSANFHGSRRPNAGSFRPGNNKSSFWPSRNGITHDGNQSWRQSSDSDSNCGHG
ncbi:5'-3' exoribonuclease 3 isoform X2 [Morus notabilis]|uniref:5'-3' exoribonuclease 3 isoform X2 n=1 Tax=Morus notabilis TaxID=981085 RepID=UPI000CED2700|nr:5'-3' exoribonuclease 3 isoform X2 [Morus notabilis]